MIIDLATEPNVAIFREPHVAGLVAHTPTGQDLHQHPSRRVHDGVVMPFDETLFRKRGCCNGPCYPMPVAIVDRRLLECWATVLPAHRPLEMLSFYVHSDSGRTRILIEGDRVAVGLQDSQGRNIALSGVERWGEEAPPTIFKQKEVLEGFTQSEPEQEQPYVEDLSTPDGAVIAAQRRLRAATGDTNLRIELEGLGWTVVPKDRVPLDLIPLGETQVRSILKLAKRYPHGWHNADLKVRQDGKEEWYEADWLRTIIQQIAAKLQR